MKTHIRTHTDHLIPLHTIQNRKLLNSSILEMPVWLDRNCYDARSEVRCCGWCWWRSYNNTTQAGTWFTSKLYLFGIYVTKLCAFCLHIIKFDEFANKKIPLISMNYMLFQQIMFIMLYERRRRGKRSNNKYIIGIMYPFCSHILIWWKHFNCLLNISNHVESYFG